MSHPTRIQILHLLFDGAKNVTEIAHQINLGQSTVSRHLAILKRNNLVITERRGQEIFYAVANPKIVEVCNLMRGVISEQLLKQSSIFNNSLGK